MNDKKKPFITPTNEKFRSLVDSPLKPDAEMHILVGGPYTKDGEEHRYGHTALFIKKNNGKELIYDFGRYGAIYTEEIGLGITLRGSNSPRGEGILNIWNNFSAYIKNENSYGRTTWGYKYLIFNNQAIKAEEFFDSLIAGKKPKIRTANFARYKLDADYFALGPNCTTLSIEGAQKAVPKIALNSERFVKPEAVIDWRIRQSMNLKYGTPSNIFLPANLKEYLDTAPYIRIDDKKTYP